MIDFTQIYSCDQSLWSSDSAENSSADNFVFLNGMQYPVNDPGGLCALLRQEEQPQLQLETTFFAEWLDLASPEGLERLKQIWQRALDGWYTLISEEQVPTQNDGRLLKFVRYYVSFFSIPPLLAAQLAAR